MGDEEASQQTSMGQSLRDQKKAERLQYEFTALRIVRLSTDASDDDCLLQQANIAKLGRANKNDQKWLRVWLQHYEGGRSFLEGCEYRAYDEMENPDLISISSRPSNDRFTRWLEMNLIPRLPTRLRKGILVSLISTHTFNALTVW